MNNQTVQTIKKSELQRKGRIDMHTFYEWDFIKEEDLKRLNMNEIRKMGKDSKLSEQLRRNVKEIIRKRTDPRSDDTIIM